MSMALALVAVVVDDYDDAIAWYTGALGFALLEDTPLAGGKRWVRVGPADASCALLLAKAVDDRQRAAVGNQAGGRVGFFLHTTDFDREHAAMSSRGVRFLEAPRQEPYGIVAVFEDIYGNRWDLVGPAL